MSGLSYRAVVGPRYKRRLQASVQIDQRGNPGSANLMCVRERVVISARLMLLHYCCIKMREKILRSFDHC